MTQERLGRGTARRRRFARDDQGDRPGAAHRARHSHAAVPALQHSLGLDDPDAADRRLCVRLEIRLWLFELLAALDAVLDWRLDLFSGRVLGLAAQARRRRRVQAAARQ